MTAKTKVSPPETNIGDWVRMPSGRNTVCGMRRGALYLLAVACKENKWKPPVKSMSKRLTGQKRGTRIIFLPSLIAHIEAEAEKQRIEAEKLAEKFTEGSMK